MTNETRYKADHIQDASKIMNRYKYSKILGLFELFVFIYIIYLILGEHYVFLIIASLIFLIIPFAFILFEKRIVTKHTVYLNKLSIPFIYHYDFQDKQVIVKLSNGGNEKEKVILYSDIKRVVDTDEVIYLFLKNDEYFPVDKYGFDKYDKLTFESLVKPFVNKYKYYKGN